MNQFHLRSRVLAMLLVGSVAASLALVACGSKGDVAAGH